MDWMYQGLSGVVDREQYLTGRKIDKTFELLEKEVNPNIAQSEEENALITQLSTNSVVENLSASDLSAKMREDPLFAIQMRQKEQRKQILQNPVKLKQIQEILKSSLKKSKKKSKKKKHKSNKKRKHERSSSSPSPSSSSKKSKRKRTSSSSSSQSGNISDTSYDEDRPVKSTHKKYSYDRSHSSTERRRHRQDSHERTSSKETHHRKSSQQARVHHRHHDVRTRSGDEKGQQRVVEKHSKLSLSEQELQRRREEMLADASRREQERSEKVRLYTKLQQDEDNRQQQQLSSGAKFIKPMLNNMASSNSIEDSIRQKRFTSQRDTGTMDKNFARRT